MQDGCTASGRAKKLRFKAIERYLKKEGLPDEQKAAASSAKIVWDSLCAMAGWASEAAEKPEEEAAAETKEDEAAQAESEAEPEHEQEAPAEAEADESAPAAPAPDKAALLDAILEAKSFDEAAVAFSQLKSLRGLSAFSFAAVSQRFADACMRHTALGHSALNSRAADLLFDALVRSISLVAQRCAWTNAV